MRSAADEDMPDSPFRQRKILPDDERMTDADGLAAILEAGAAILGVVLLPAGFTFQLVREGRGSGGDFAAGRFIRGSQYLEFHFRHSLGLVTYGWGDADLSHADYLHGAGVTGSYPGYSSDPLDGFRHLAADLAGPLSQFVEGDRAGYERGLRAASRPPGSQDP